MRLRISSLAPYQRVQLWPRAAMKGQWLVAAAENRARKRTG